MPEEAIPVAVDALATDTAAATVADVAAVDAAAGASTVWAGTAAAAGTAGTAATVVGGLKTASTILGPIASAYGAVVNAANSRQMGIRSGSPQVTPPTTMPFYGDANSQAAQQQSLTAQMQRRGRASTILTAPDASNTLGG